MEIHQVHSDAISASYPNPHTPEERRKLSNLGHWIEGAVLGIAGGLALLDATKRELEWPGRWWPRLTAAAGVALGGFIIGGTFHHGGPRLYLRHEHQDREHLEMAAIIAAGGTLEAVGRGRLARLATAAALTTIGRLFLAHEQHGRDEAQTRAKVVHQRLGYTLVLTGGAKAADALEIRGPWRVVWPVLALLVAAQLLRYSEPVGAFE
jgi:hypothetical protein